MSKFTVFLKTDSYVLIDHCHKSTAYILFATRQFNPTTGYPLQNYFFAASLTHLVYYFIRVQLFPSKFRRTECSSLLPRFELVSSFFFAHPLSISFVQRPSLHVSYWSTYRMNEFVFFFLAKKQDSSNFESKFFQNLLTYDQMMTTLIEM